MSYPSVMRQWGCLFLITVFWCSITGAFAFFVFRTIYLHLDAQARYLPVDGVVTDSEIIKKRGSKGSTTYHAVVTYRYTVKGREYTATGPTFDASSGWSFSSTAHETHGRYPRGRSVTVYYDPRRPEVAILDLGVPGSVLFTLLFLQPFLMIGLALILGAIRAPVIAGRRKRFLKAPPKLPWEIPGWNLLRKAGGTLCIARRPSVVTRALVGWGLSGFLSMFLGLLLIGAIKLPEKPTLAGLFAVCGAVAVLAGVHAWKRDRLAVTIDPGGREVRLAGPSEVRRVPFDAIAEVRLFWTWRTGKRGPVKNAARLALARSDGSEEPLHDFGEPDDAWPVAEKAGAYFAAAVGKPFKLDRERASLA